MSAIFQINQVAPGSPDLARRDLQLFSVGGLVTLVASDLSRSIYIWEVISAPIGSTAPASVTPIGSPATSATVALDMVGSYIFRLTVDIGLSTEDTASLFGGIPLPVSGLCLPAFNETTQDNSDGTPHYGYGPKLNALLERTDPMLSPVIGRYVMPAVPSDTAVITFSSVGTTSYSVLAVLEYTGAGVPDIVPFTVYDKTPTGFSVKFSDVLGSDYTFNWALYVG